MSIVVILLDLMRVHNFHCQTVNMVKMLLLLELLIVLLYILIIEKNGILNLNDGPTSGSDGTTITAKAKYSVSITKSRQNVCLSLHYNGINSLMFANGVKFYQFKQNNSKKNSHCLCLGNFKILIS